MLKMDNGTEPPTLNATLPADPSTSTEYQVVSLFILIVVCGLGIFGNVVVIIAVLLTKQLKTPTNCLLVSLAVADLIVLTAVGLPAITSGIFGYWAYGHHGCSIITYFQYLGINTSAAFIVAITVERYITICHPIKAQTLCTIPRAKKCIAILWIVTGLYCITWFYLAGLEEVAGPNGTYVICGYRVKRNLYMRIYLVDFGIFFVLPLLLAAILYGLIAKALHNDPLTPTDPNEEGEKEVENRDAGDQEASREPNHANSVVASSRQVTKMLAVVVLLFALCWMPYRNLVVINSLLNKPYLERGFLLFCRICIYINSAINPIVYSTMSLKFRSAIWKLLHCDQSAEGRAEAALASSPDQTVSLVGTTGCTTTELDEFSATNRPLSANTAKASDE